STNIITSITAEQISRSPDSDAAAAVQRVSGVSVQDGKYVTVRGLSELYTTTSLNGARLPSPEPERKVVPLDLFPAGLLQSITTAKNFTPDLPGDFSGARVDIRTREFPASRQISYSLGMGANLLATGKDVLAAPTDGMEWLGLGGSDRALPGVVSGFGNFAGQSPTQSETNAMVRSFRNVWRPNGATGSPNVSGSVSMGGNDPILGRNIGYLASLSYSRSQELRDKEVRAYPDATVLPDGGFREIDRFEGQTGRNSVLWGGLLNFSTMLGTSGRLQFNNSYTRTSDNEARSERGFSENLGRELFVDRLRFVSRSVRTHQIAGEHDLRDNGTRLQWSLTNSGVTRSEPDRSEIVYTRDTPGGQLFWLDDPQSAARTFADLDEMSNDASLDLRLPVGNSLNANYLKIGALTRYTTRDADNSVYSIQAPSLGIDGRELSPTQIFDSYSGSDASVFRVVPLSQGGSYSATDMLAAGYGMLDWGLSDRLRVIAGARVEFNSVELDADPTIGAAQRTSPEFTDVLPSLALNYSLTHNQNLRLSASQTLARPEYRELAPVQFRDVIGAENVIGNPELVRSLIRNVDVRWEWYPDRGELLSVAVFGKQFDKPIEQVFLGTSGTRIISFANAREAVNYGVEFEARKSLRFLASALEPLTVFSNVTLMDSRITLGNNSSFPAVDRPMVGQAPYVVNAGMTWESLNAGTSATVLFNRVGRRIYSAAEAPFPSVYDEARNVLDLSLRFPVVGGLSAKVDAKNLLDAPYERTQGNVVRESFNAGRVLSVGFSWSR
ncbi:MAG TPA: TonB-dependent receptor, partial [Gemmatimonadales bacterium]|nr:TonB-dependent receptor [Gemmatimonadales bacterium]